MSCSLLVGALVGPLSPESPLTPVSSLSDFRYLSVPVPRRPETFGESFDLAVCRLGSDWLRRFLALIASFVGRYWSN